MAITEEERAKVKFPFVGRGLQQMRQGIRPTATQLTVASRPASANAAPPGFSGNNASAWVGQGMRNYVAPAAKYVAGNVADAAYLIPRAFGRVSDNIWRGATGQEPNQEPFVMNPITRGLMGGERGVGGQSLPGRDAGIRQEAARPAPPTTPGTGYGASYDTGRAASFNGDQVAIAGADGMRQSMSVKDFHDMMNPNATQRVGNMDVTFDPSVSPEAKAAFLQDPVKPQAQMDRYDANMAAQRVSPGRRPLSSTEGSIGEMVVDGIRQRRSQFQTQQDVAMRGQDIQAEEGGMRNRLLAERNASQIPLERAQGEAAQMEVNSALRAQRLFDAINNEPDEAKKALLTQQYKLLTGVKDTPNETWLAQDESMDPKGGMRTDSSILERLPDGRVIRRIPETAGGASAEPLPPPDKRVVGKKYVGAGGRVAIWDGTGLIEEK